MAQSLKQSMNIFAPLVSPVRNRSTASRETTSNNCQIQSPTSPSNSTRTARSTPDLLDIRRRWSPLLRRQASKNRDIVLASITAQTDGADSPQPQYPPFFTKHNLPRKCKSEPINDVTIQKVNIRLQKSVQKSREIVLSPKSMQGKPIPQPKYPPYFANNRDLHRTRSKSPSTDQDLPRKGRHFCRVGKKNQDIASSNGSVFGGRQPSRTQTPTCHKSSRTKGIPERRLQRIHSTVSDDKQSGDHFVSPIIAKKESLSLPTTQKRRISDGSDKQLRRPRVLRRQQSKNRDIVLASIEAQTEDYDAQQLPQMCSSPPSTPPPPPPLEALKDLDEQETPKCCNQRKAVVSRILQQKRCSTVKLAHNPRIDIVLNQPLEVVTLQRLQAIEAAHRRPLPRCPDLIA